MGINYNDWDGDDVYSIKFHLIEGEYFTYIVEDNGYLYAVTNLNRIFKSTDAKAPHFDFVEVDLDG